MTCHPTITLVNLHLIEEARTHEEQLYVTLQVYLNSFPVNNAYLFRYSHLGYLGEGIISIKQGSLVHIRDIRDDIRSLSPIYSAIYEKKAKYCSGIDYFKQITSRYVSPPHVNSFLVVPITFHSVTIGYICTDEFEESIHVDNQLLANFTEFGQEVGKILQKSLGPEENELLSPRELEVVRRVSWGESTKEMADAMNISEATIHQYVKSVMKKLKVQNRAHAVAELFRRGLLT